MRVGRRIYRPTLRAAAALFIVLPAVIATGCTPDTRGTGADELYASAATRGATADIDSRPAPATSPGVTTPANHTGNGANSIVPDGPATNSALQTGSDPRDIVGTTQTPAGMAFIPGGTAQIGSDDAWVEESPAFSEAIDPFLLDIAPVTVAQFREFVAATGYETESERHGDSGVFNYESRHWELRKGANWHHPLGPDGPVAEDDHPVTHVSWNDASAYADWAGKRLPSEIEWEWAARGASADITPYPWGAAAQGEEAYRANTWQGLFPVENTGEDGFLFTSPVGTFGTTELGLADMSGNVWEWTSDWFRPYAERGTGYSPNEQSERVQRGGSFLCHDSYCHGYRVSARGHSTPESAHFNVGFRCAKDA